MTPKSEGGNAFMKTMQRKGLGSNISQELWQSIHNPIVFNPLSGDPGHGYKVDVLIDAVESTFDLLSGGDGSKESKQQSGVPLLSDIRDAVADTAKEIDRD